jgi:hypothetical protein
MRVFGGVAAFEGAFEFAQIFRERRGFAAAPVCGWLFVKKDRRRSSDADYQKPPAGSRVYGPILSQLPASGGARAIETPVFTE